MSNYKNINFLLETRAIAQMKGLLILIKSYIKHICQNQYLTLFWGLEGRKGLKKDEFSPILNLDFVKI